MPNFLLPDVYNLWKQKFVCGFSCVSSCLISGGVFNLIFEEVQLFWTILIVIFGKKRATLLMGYSKNVDLRDSFPFEKNMTKFSFERDTKVSSSFPLKHLDTRVEFLILQSDRAFASYSLVEKKIWNVLPKIITPLSAFKKFKIRQNSAKVLERQEYIFFRIVNQVPNFPKSSSVSFRLSSTMWLIIASFPALSLQIWSTFSGADMVQGIFGIVKIWWDLEQIWVTSEPNMAGIKDWNKAKLTKKGKEIISWDWLVPDWKPPISGRNSISN